MPEHGEAIIHGSPGEGARVAGILRAVLPLLLMVFAAGYTVGAVVHWPACDRHDLAAAGLLTIMAAALLGGACRCRRRVESFFKGAEGEEVVGRMLSRLPLGHEVFHSLDAGGGAMMWRGGDIDHVVVGPSGVYVIETKNWRGIVTLEDGRLLLNGRLPRRAPLVQAQKSAAVLRARLGRAGLFGVPLTPVVCFAGNAFSDSIVVAGDVLVCNAGKLLDALAADERRGRAQIDVRQVATVIGPAPGV